VALALTRGPWPAGAKNQNEGEKIRKRKEERGKTAKPSWPVARPPVLPSFRPPVHPSSSDAAVLLDTWVFEYRIQNPGNKNKIPGLTESLKHACMNRVIINTHRIYASEI
jgi:hypothetical protein